MVTLTQLEELIRFAECSTLSGAAEKCHISQPALSRSMQKLEDDFGVPLFNRGKNRTALNACGRLAAEGARRIISGVQGVLENVRALDRRLRTISVGSCAPAPLWDIVPLLAALYRDRTISTELREDHELIRDWRQKTTALPSSRSPFAGMGLSPGNTGKNIFCSRCLPVIPWPAGKACVSAISTVRPYLSARASASGKRSPGRKCRIRIFSCRSALLLSRSLCTPTPCPASPAIWREGAGSWNLTA